MEKIKKKKSQIVINENFAQNKWNYSESELDNMTVPNFSKLNDVESYLSADYDMYQQKRYRSSKRKSNKEGSNFAKKKSIGASQLDIPNSDSYENELQNNDANSSFASIFTISDDLTSDDSFISDDEIDNHIVNIETISQTSKELKDNQTNDNLGNLNKNVLSLFFSLI